MGNISMEFIDDNVVKIKINNNGNNINLNISMEEFLQSQENRDDLPLRVTNLNKMSNWVSSYIERIDYEDGVDVGFTSNAFYNYINTMFQLAYEEGEAWLEGIVVEETN